MIFLDIETTGLDPDRHEVWEVALLTPSEEITWAIQPEHLASADSTSLRLVNYHERTDKMSWTWDSQQVGRAYIAKRIAAITAGEHLAGIVPSFDAAFLERFLRQHGTAPAWHYQFIDVEVAAAGRLAVAPPYDTEYICHELGLDLTSYEKHTALGDARLARDLWFSFMPGARATEPGTPPHR